MRDIGRYCGIGLYRTRPWQVALFESTVEDFAKVGGESFIDGQELGEDVSPLKKLLPVLFWSSVWSLGLWKTGNAVGNPSSRGLGVGCCAMLHVSHD